MIKRSGKDLIEQSGRVPRDPKALEPKSKAPYIKALMKFIDAKLKKQKIQRQNRSPFSLIYFIIFSVRSYTKNIAVNYVP